MKIPARFIGIPAIIAAAVALLAGQEPGAPFRAGAAAVDITPEAFPVRVNGMFTERSAERALDPLHAKAIALDDGASKIVLCVVDSCMMPRSLIERAKAIVTGESGLPAERMMVSATHTHSAPSVTGCLGSRADPGYADWLPGKVAEAMLAALENLQPARVGWASVDDWRNTHNRRWILRADRVRTDPFGDPTVMANMHPGYLSPDVIGPSGPVDPELGVLAVQSLDGEPLALLANYSQHYFGSGLLSADYFGAFSRQVGTLLGKGGDDDGFVAVMSQGTSGDLMWMDYGAPQENRGLEAYAGEVAANAARAYANITWQDHARLDVAVAELVQGFRLPDDRRLAWARQTAAGLGDRLPDSQAEIYANEALFLHEAKQAAITLQAIRIGDLGIAALPNEVYALTGLKLKEQSPFAAHFNIELANGADGYIPPPEQHALGGYTTWPARTAGLEVGAEPRIVETLLTGLEQIAGRKRRPVTAGRGRYPEAVSGSKPLAYWRLDDIAGDVARDEANSNDARIVGKAARYLPGAGSGSGCGAGQQLRPSPFSGPDHLNRAIHLVDGYLEAELPGLGTPFSIALWFWLGERSGASDRTGTLVKLPTGDVLGVDQSAEHLAHLTWNPRGRPAVATATPLRADDWHLAILVCEERETSLFIDGAPDAAARAGHDLLPVGKAIRFGEGLEGKLDEIAVFHRALSADERAALWNASGIAEIRAEQEAERERAARRAAELARPPAFAASYHARIGALKPILHRAQPGTGRSRHEVEGLGDAYTVSLWFRNGLPNDARPVTAYLFSRGPDADPAAAGDHLGIGGTHQPGSAGRMIVFNGNAAGGLAVGAGVVAPGEWHHVVLIRDGKRVRLYLNGAAMPEADSELEVTTGGSREVFTGARSDRFAPLDGHLAEFALFDRALAHDEALSLFSGAGVEVR